MLNEATAVGESKSLRTCHQACVLHFIGLEAEPGGIELARTREDPDSLSYLRTTGCQSKGCRPHANAQPVRSPSPGRIASSLWE